MLGSGSGVVVTQNCYTWLQKLQTALLSTNFAAIFSTSRVAWHLHTIATYLTVSIAGLLTTKKS